VPITVQGINEGRPWCPMTRWRMDEPYDDGVVGLCDSVMWGVMGRGWWGSCGATCYCSMLWGVFIRIATGDVLPRC